MNLTPTAIRIVERAAAIAKVQAYEHVTAAHLLLAMAIEPSSTKLILQDHGLDEDVLRDLLVLPDPVIDFQI